MVYERDKHANDEIKKINNLPNSKRNLLFSDPINGRQEKVEPLTISKKKHRW